MYSTNLNNMKMKLVCEKCGESYILAENAISITSEETISMLAGIFGYFPPCLMVGHASNGTEQEKLDESATTILQLGPQRGWDCAECKHKNSWKYPY